MFSILGHVLGTIPVICSVFILQIVEMVRMRVRSLFVVVIKVENMRRWFGMGRPWVGPACLFGPLSDFRNCPI